MRIREAFLGGAMVWLGVSGASAAGIPHAAEGLRNRVFARIVSGGGWDTVVVITNLGAAAVPFRQFFLGRDGKAAAFTVRVENGNGELTTSALQGTVGANASTRFTLGDPSGAVQEGWSVLTFDETQGQLGGYAVIQHQIPRGELTEATVPLSDMQDFSVRMPFDNTGDFRSQLTVVNPAGNLAAQVSLNYYDSQGQVILLDLLELQPGEQVTIDVPNTYPDLANRAGTVAVAANMNRLSVAGIRYGSASGAVAALPAMVSDRNSNIQ